MTDLYANFRAQLDGEAEAAADDWRAAAPGSPERDAAAERAKAAIRETIALRDAHQGEPTLPITSARVAEVYGEFLANEHARLTTEARVARGHLVALSLVAVEDEESDADLVARVAARREQILALIEVNTKMQHEARRLAALLAAHDGAEAA